MMAFSAWKRWRGALGLAVTLAVVAVLARALDWPKVVASLAGLPPSAILVCLLSASVSQVLLALRWGVLVAAPRLAVPLDGVLLAAHAGLFNLITPAALGGDVFRVASHTRGGRVRSAKSVLLDRALGIWAYAIVFITCAWIVSGYHADARSRLPAPFALAFVILAIIAVGGPVAAVMIPMNSRVIDALDARFPRLRAVLSSERRQTASTLAVAAALSIGSVYAWVVAATVMVAQFDPSLGLPRVALIAILTEFARLIPISAQGIGVREVAFGALAALLGGSGQGALVACTILYVVNYGAVALFGVSAALLRRRFARTKASHIHR